MDQAAQMLGLSRRTLEYLAASKSIITIKVGKRRLVRYSSLLSFAQRDHPIEKAQRQGVVDGQ
jgi:excisionase family DNA binding protein